MYVCAPCIGMYLPMGSRRGSSGIGVSVSCEVSYGHWTLNSGPVRAVALLTAELAL